MKKMAVVILMFIIIIGGVGAENKFSLLDYFSGNYKVYTSTSNSEDAINLGFCYVNTKPQVENVVGESMEIKNFEISSALKTLNAKVVKTEYLDDGTTIIYAYTHLIDVDVKVSGSLVNLQIATKNETTIIGWPLILGSY